jgi:hypothetical protein
MLRREANAPQAKNTPFFRSSSMAAVVNIELTLKYDILDITAHLIPNSGMSSAVAERKRRGKNWAGRKTVPEDNPATSTSGSAFEGKSSEHIENRYLQCSSGPEEHSPSERALLS